MVGQNIGKYRVADRVGRGGMGTVYRAVDETLHREVAIKVLNAELNDPEIAKRFRAEAITVARLNHPGIATIYELFQHEGQWLMVMEFVRGETLEHLVERMGPLSAQRAAELCMQSLAALAHAHSMGVVHRDLKPANLMITEMGSVKIMDFGIARVSGTEHLTNAGYMMGTPAYMAPEQVLGHEIDARADLYAVGVVFYRLVTKALPFKGESPFAMAQSQVNEPPTPIGTLRTDLPPWVDQVIVRALAKNPVERFQSAVEFHEGFARCLAGLPLTSAYSSSAPTELMMTPARAMPTGSIRTPTGLSGTMPLGTPPMSTPPMTTPPMSTPADPTMAAPASGAGGTPAVPVGPADRTMMASDLTPAAAAATVAGPAGTGAKTVAPKGSGPGTKDGKGAQAAAGDRGGLLAIGAGVLVIALIGLGWWAWSSSGTPPVPPSPVDAMADGTVTPPGPPPTDIPLPLDPGATVEGADPAAAGAAGAGTGSGATGASGAATGAAGTSGTSGTPPAARGGSATGAGAPAGAGGGRNAASSGAGQAGGAGTGVGAGAGGGVNAETSPATPEPPAARPSDPLLAFADVRIVLVDGSKGRDADAQVIFGNGRVIVQPPNAGTTLASMDYRRIRVATYVKARDPKWDASVFGPPADLDTPGTMFRRAAHWLVLQGADAFIILRLEDSNAQRILETVESRTGLKIARP
ncbi:MAG: serine/threonine-protein kinase [Vicinamibacterales bacterium]